ncbi:unnamed protein product, partial [Ostreobium quekettii]
GQDPLPSMVSASNPPSQPARTPDQQVKALLEFKAALTDDEGVLQNWREGSDPCLDGWDGVECNCTERVPDGLPPVPFCEERDAHGPDPRVLELTLGDSNREEMLNGMISPALGNLPELWKLDLSGQAFTGTIPDALVNLKNLAFLSLRSNQLTGTLPAFLSEFELLTEVLLGQNDFEGAVPASWCNQAGNRSETPGFRERISLEGNLGLCGKLPDCFNETSPRFKETNLQLGDGMGGVCDQTPPVCDEAEIIVPKFWTNASQITFNFTGCKDNDSGISEETFSVQRSGSPEDEKGGLVKNESLPEPVVEEMKEGRKVRMFVFNLTEVELKDGNHFIVIVTSANKAGPKLLTSISSEDVTVDSSAPEPGTVTLQCVVEGKGYDGNCPVGKGVQQDGAGRELNVRWTGFRDNHTDVEAYSIKVSQQPAQIPGEDPVEPVDLNVTMEFVREDLKSFNSSSEQNATETGMLVFEQNVTVRAIPEGDSYVVEVLARNEAGLERQATATIAVVATDVVGGNGPTRGALAAIIVSAVVAGALVAGALVWFFVRGRMGNSQESASQRRVEMLKELMNGLLDVPSETEKDRRNNREPIDQSQFEKRDVAFVVTDLESSSAMAQHSETVFTKMLDVHNFIIRELLEQENGYEIGTEGDSFQIAFTSIVDAVVFCMNVQYRFLQHKWTNDMLKLPSCSTEKSAVGDLLFKGPRVRMGIHWAAEGTVTSRAHPETKRHFFAGPAFDVANELGNAACGGQVLMTYDAWKELQPHMKYAEFPTVEQVGLFRIPKWPTPIWLYEVKQLIGRPLGRAFPEGPRGLTQVEKGSGLRITPPPRPGGKLCFVSARMTFPPSVDGLPDMPISLAESLYSVLATQAQQFGGYIYWCQVEVGQMTLVFQQTLEAVRYCHSVQAHLVHLKLPEEELELCGPIVSGKDGYIFRGPRVALAVHTTKEYEEVQLSGAPGGEGGRVIYQGPGEDFTRRLCKIINGGQTVLSDQAWAVVQDKIPAKSQSISLGKHIIDDVVVQAVMLMEVLPTMLAERNFGDLRSKGKLEPGFRDSPPDSQDMAIVFIKAEKPDDVGHAEKSGKTEGVSNDHVRKVLTAYHEGVSMYCDLVRRCLKLYDGYECKEPESGKFTLAFRQLDKAICWGAHMQVEMLQLNWPAELLEMEQCRAETNPSLGTVIWKGLRIRMGMVYGDPGQRQPLKTGRADYFGNLPNLAARISNLAAPGQILFDATNGNNLGFDVQWIQKGEVGLLHFPPDVHINEEVVELRNMGRFLLRGFEKDPKLVYQAVPLSLMSRDFKMNLRNGALRLTESPSDQEAQRTVLRKALQRLRGPLGPGGRFGIKLPKRRRGKGERNKGSPGREGPAAGRHNHLDTNMSIDSSHPMLGQAMRSSTFNDASSLSPSVFNESPRGDPSGESGNHSRPFANGSFVPERSALSVVSNRSRSPVASTHDSEGPLPSMTSGGPYSMWRMWREVSPDGSFTEQVRSSRSVGPSSLSQVALAGNGRHGDSPGDDAEDSGSGSSPRPTTARSSRGARGAPRWDSESAFAKPRTDGSFAREVAEVYARRGPYSSPAHSQPDSAASCVDVESQDNPQASARSAPNLWVAGLAGGDRREWLQGLNGSSAMARHGRTRSKDWMAKRPSRLSGD